MKSFTVIMGCDNAAVELKEAVKAYLDKNKIPYEDMGCDSSKDPTVYPEIARRVCERIMESGYQDRGILICGTGIGMAISANKFPGIRAAVCHDIFSTERSVLRNNCSVMCMGERVIGKELAIKMVEKWISLEFVDGSSTPKVNAIKEIERETMVEPDKIAHTKKKIG